MATKRKKTGKRARGEGSVTLRKDGRWRTSMTLEGRKRKYFYGDNQAEALEKLHKAQEQQKQGKLATGPQQTVTQFLEDWLENVHRHKIRENSYKMYRSHLDLYVLPAFGHVKLQKLSAYQIETLYVNLQKKGLKAETIRSIHGMLHKAFNDAVRWKRLSHNPCDDAQRPGPEEFEIHPLTRAEAKKVLETATKYHMEALLTLAVTTAMRKGEILALRWQDISFAERSIRIQRTAYYIPGKGMIVSEPKTPKSKSTILLPQFVVDLLLLHRDYQTIVRVKSANKWEEHDLVFCNRYGKLTWSQNLTKMFKKILKEAGIAERRFHDLRHSAATILLEMGVHPKLVQELLRHTKISTTMDRYSHVTPDMQRKMMDDLNGFFNQ